MKALRWLGSLSSKMGLQIAASGSRNFQHCPVALPPLLLQWHATVYAHRKAEDSHIKLATVVDGRPVAADVTDDRLIIRIPNAPGGLRFPWLSSFLACIALFAFFGV